MKVAFHSNQLSISGTEVALFDYAYYNKTLLGNESIVIAKDYSIYNNTEIIEKFKKHFKVILYNDFSTIEKQLDENNVDIFYAQKSGEYDGIIFV